MARIVLIVIALLPALAAADVIRPDSGPTPLDPAVRFLEDSGGVLGIDAVRAASAAGAFRASDAARGLNFGLFASVCWLRFTLEARSTAVSDYLIEEGFYALTDLRLYYPDSPVLETGQHQPAVDRPWPHWHPVFPVQLSADTPPTYYLRVASMGSSTSTAASTCSGHCSAASTESTPAAACPTWER